jgi:hypothetical protein
MPKFAVKVLTIILALAALSLAGCTRGNETAGGPRDRLHRYISKTFEVRSPSDRAELAEFMTGEARTRLDAWTDEQFRDAFIEHPREFVKLVWREMKNVSPDEVSITYELTYLDQSRGKDAKVTNRKICQLLRKDGKWYITDVRNVKELIEYRSEMAFDIKP